MRIIFMGTPEFAVPSLDALIQSDHDVVAVVTSTDKYGGRGKKKLIASAVKKHALAHGIPVLQPPNLKRPSFIEALDSYKADLQVIVAFRMLPEVVWSMPRLGSINLHGSLLPAYRGAAPIHWAVIRGEQQTGLTTFQLQHDIDTGEIYDQAVLDIGPDETTGELHDRMMIVGADLVTDTVDKIANGNAIGRPQDPSLISHAPKLFKENTRISFDQSARATHNFIRGLHPFPTAHTTLNSVSIKLLRSSTVSEEWSAPRLDDRPGSLWVHKHQLYVKCKDGWLEILELQQAGKRAMAARDFINGADLENAYFK